MLEDDGNRSFKTKDKGRERLARDTSRRCETVDLSASRSRLPGTTPWSAGWQTKTPPQKINTGRWLKQGLWAKWNDVTKALALTQRVQSHHRNATRWSQQGQDCRPNTESSYHDLEHTKSKGSYHMKQDKLDCIVDPTVYNHPELAMMLGGVLILLLLLIAAHHISETFRI